MPGEVGAIAMAVGAISNMVGSFVKAQMAKLDRIAAVDNAVIAYDSAMDSDLNKAALAAQQQTDRVILMVVGGVFILIGVLVALKKR